MAKVPRGATYQNNRDRSVTIWLPRRNPLLIEQWKQHVPYQYRGYDPDDHGWTFFPPYTEIALQLLFRHYMSAEGRDEEPRRSYTTPKSWQDDEPYTTLHLLPTAPKAVIDAAYRALAKVNHPDVGGDPGTMRRITEAHEALSRRLSA